MVCILRCTGRGSQLLKGTHNSKRREMIFRTDNQQACQRRKKRKLSLSRAGCEDQDNIRWEKTEKSGQKARVTYYFCCTTRTGVHVFDTGLSRFNGDRITHRLQYLRLVPHNFAFTKKCQHAPCHDHMYLEHLCNANAALYRMQIQRADTNLA